LNPQKIVTDAIYGGCSFRATGFEATEINKSCVLDFTRASQREGQVLGIVVLFCADV